MSRHSAKASPPSCPWQAITDATFVLAYLAWFLLSPGGDIEEARNGMAARGLLDGLVMPLVHYQYQPWGHGSLIEGLLLAGPFALTGSLMVWNKLLTAAFALAGYFAWTRLALAFDRRTALASAALWIAAPPFFLHLLHTGWANHMESAALVGLLLLFAVRRGGKLGLAGAYSLGAASAAAGLFCAQAWLAVPAVAWLLWTGSREERVAPWPRIAAFAAGLALAWPAQAAFYRATQWNGANALSAWNPFEARRLFMLAVEPSRPDLTAAGALVELFRDVFPRFLGYRQPLASALALVLAAAGAVATIVARRGREGGSTLGARPERRLGVALALFVGAWLASFALGPFRLDSPRSPYAQRYLVVLVPALILWGAYAATRARAGALAIVVLVAAGAWDDGALAALKWDARFPGSFSAILAERGDDALLLYGAHWPGTWRQRVNSGEEPCDVVREVAEAASRLPMPWRRLSTRALRAWKTGGDADLCPAAAIPVDGPEPDVPPEMLRAALTGPLNNCAELRVNDWVRDARNAAPGRTVDAGVLREAILTELAAFAASRCRLLSVEGWPEADRRFVAERWPALGVTPVAAAGPDVLRLDSAGD